MTADPLFVNERLPVEIEQGAKGGPGFLTTVLPLQSGKEKRNQEWSLQRLKWDIAYGIQTKDDYEEVMAFFYVCAGRAHAFRFKDWSDFEIGRTAPQLVFTGNGVATTFQATRLYVAGSSSFSRKITRLVQNSTPPLALYDNGVAMVEGTGFSVNYDTGVFTKTSGTWTNGHLFTLYAQFDVPTRFDSDELSTTVTWADAMALSGITILEIKE